MPKKLPKNITVPVTKKLDLIDFFYNEVITLKVTKGFKRFHKQLEKARQYLFKAKTTLEPKKKEQREARKKDILLFRALIQEQIRAAENAEFVLGIVNEDIRLNKWHLDISEPADSEA
tara:strand:+ start:9650 stop:10003 length:354 start_codon:yes stop_codon:yes gene_type:complete